MGWKQKHLKMSVSQVVDLWKVGTLYLVALSLFNDALFHICPKAHFLSLKKTGRGQGSVPPTLTK